MILALNTAEPMHELALLRANPANPGEFELIAEKTWPDERRDVDTLAPFLQELLDGAGLSKAEITDVVVAQGPASFTSLRTGVAFANALAYGLGAKIYALNTFTMLRRKAAVTAPTLIILHAGRMDVGVKFEDEAVKVGSLAALLKDYPHQNIHVIADLPEALNDELSSIVLEKNWTRVQGHELQSLAEMIMTFGLTDLEAVETVEPAYLRGPHITVSTDPWKK
ncbi:MAG: tRNA (adenosine(37)-N6)-threonylcarbamoyltransferase complex dimerization subunit type 1 TsaB [Patescibacteria group bacterium]